ncbi:hypothetical protein M404DRAFT_393190 [Pisolithus tinctorius Marx 270]|uniref:Uncharacterized protein n=1 Tax=Pisolithus tinctorius Marx 270 TaxID=870435 RepID=A0A0C3PI40_PISTI|nr:hypothetical protein M404DRAFT_393190 [Pisolithus tinctorius Marx 270]
MMFEAFGFMWGISCSAENYLSYLRVVLPWQHFPALVVRSNGRSGVLFFQGYT